MTAPGLGDHHHRHMRHRAAGQHEQFKDIVESGRITAVGNHDRQDLVGVFPELFRNKLHLAGMHPVDVTAQGVDLPIVRDHPVRVGQRPGRKRVGAVTRVHHCDSRDKVLVGQILVKSVDLLGHQLTFIGQGLGGQADHVKITLLRQGRLLDIVIHPFADHIQLAFKRVGGGVLAAADKDLLEVRLRGTGDLTDFIAVMGDLAPAQQALAFFVNKALEHLLDFIAVTVVRRQKDDTDTIIPQFRQIDVPRGALFAQKFIGDLNKDPGPVPGARIASARAPVG